MSAYRSGITGESRGLCGTRTPIAMEWLDAQRRVAGGEDAHAEFKRKLGDLRGVGRTICAFANGEGGLVVIGVDYAGVVVVAAAAEEEEEEEEAPEAVQERLASLLQTGLRQARDCGVRQAGGGGRVGSLDRRAPPSARIRAVLLRPPVLDQTRAEHGGAFSLGAAGSAERFRTRADGEADPSVGDRRRHRFGAYGGTDQAAEVLSAGQGKGRLQDQVQRAMGWCRSLGRREMYEGIRRIDVPPVPEAALREALVNTVIHRDYSITGSQVLLEVFDDRIVVTSPGALPKHMTVDQARKGGAPRSPNEMMANAMVVAGLMERRGRGWLTMRHTMRRFNGTEARLVSDERSRFVRVTFERGHAVPDSAASKFKTALDGLEHHFEQVRRQLGDEGLGRRHPSVRQVGLAVVFHGWEMAACEAVGDGPEAVDHGGTTKRGRI